MVVLAGWVVERTPPEDFVRRTLFFCIAVIVVLVLRLRFLRDLERGFRTQQRVAVRIEDELGLYRGIYPLEWKRAGTESAPGRFFASTYALLYAGLLVVAVALFFETAVQGFLVLLRR